MAYSFPMIRQHVYMDCVVCVTVAQSFACAPRWGVALVGFVSTEHSSPRHGTPPFKVLVTCGQAGLLKGQQLRKGPGCGLDVFLYMHENCYS